jgi:hypothetical protein
MGKNKKGKLKVEIRNALRGFFWTASEALTLRITAGDRVNL